MCHKRLERLRACTNKHNESERTMSEAPNTNTEANTDAPKPARKRKVKRYTVGQMAVARAKARGIDTSRAAKDVRGRCARTSMPCASSTRASARRRTPRTMATGGPR
jgi:hypothetical protein